ncbi:trehalose operon repressor [Pontibacillus marinus]|uniref:Trehalose operon repressor n=1 Tax=Pontibacillus marinus BH030004 = DSM 16465 TaxID=1385511 RepID=A0A0A5G5W3_9BACI|nr:trehalose operon repressor [Pontibacillus marinus]KGX86533.1 GntR family transcriptional regulator [Pontibacillus marinus BH030004 = DSM 16465]
MKQNKFLTIYHELVESIKNGEYPAQSTLPSENELADLYQTSRETIRKALNLLSQNGFIQKVRGKGSVVLDQNKFDFPVSGLVSFKELADSMGEKPKTTVHELSLSHPKEVVQQALNLDENNLVWHVSRIRNLGGSDVILDKDYILYEQVPKLTKEICEDSIYAYLEGELGLNISFAKKEITAEDPTEEDRNLLDLEGFTTIVVIKNYVYLNDATLFQFTESRHRPDKFRFVDFARR